MSTPSGARRLLTTSEGLNRGDFTARDWTLFVSISLIWGSSFLLMAIGLEAFEPGLITLLRVGLGAGALWLAPQARANRIARIDWPRLVALSFVWVAIPFTLFPIAQQHINSAVTGMLNGAMPIFAAVIAIAMLGRLPSGRTIVGLVVGFGGVVAISLPSIGEGSSEALGVALVVLATACYGLAVNMAAPIQQKYGSIPVMARMLALATLWTAPFGLIGATESSFAWGPFLAVAGAGVVGTGIAFVVMGSLVGRVGSTRASFITYVIPVVAVVLGVVFLGDEVTPLALVGTALVIGGALLASRRD
ncbi:MAG: DMT family transporter [Actinomycetota bacterium]